MALQEATVGKNQILELVESAAEVAVNVYGLKIWGLDLVGGAVSPVVRVFVDTPWEGRIIPFVMPETRSQKSKKKTVHPKKMEAEAEPDAINVFNDASDNASGGNSSHSSSEKATDFDVDGANDDISAGGINIESVSIAQCAHISRMIGMTLEVEDTFADAWVLEVSSPGLERGFYHLSQLASYLGHPVEITLEDAHPDFESRRKFRGTLKSVEDFSFTLILDAPLDTPCSILWDAVKKAHLVHIFPDTTLSKA